MIAYFENGEYEFKANLLKQTVTNLDTNATFRDGRTVTFRIFWALIRIRYANGKFYKRYGQAGWYGSVAHTVLFRVLGGPYHVFFMQINYNKEFKKYLNKIGLVNVFTMRGGLIKLNSNITVQLIK